MPTVISQEKFFIGRFQAMGCACEVLVDTNDPAVGNRHLEEALREAKRIEKKYSRFRSGTIVDRINKSDGKSIVVDEETAALLDYAAECYSMSHGLFDITTGVLRNRSFKNKDPLEQTVGWDKVQWNPPHLHLPVGMEIDLGGICKEYATDRILSLLKNNHTASVLVNLGGDISAAGQRLWSVGIENPSQPGEVIHTVSLRQGALATSGSTKRQGHILNPKTGESILGAPSSVTVTANSCTEAGFWSTLAMLQGDRAEDFLREQALKFWCYRPFLT